MSACVQRWPARREARLRAHRRGCMCGPLIFEVARSAFLREKHPLFPNQKPPVSNRIALVPHHPFFQKPLLSAFFTKNPVGNEFFPKHDFFEVHALNLFIFSEKICIFLAPFR